MTNVNSKIKDPTRCQKDNCHFQSRYNFRGQETSLYCMKHAEFGMVENHQPPSPRVNRKDKKCLSPGCDGIAIYAVHSSGKIPLYCKRCKTSKMSMNKRKEYCRHGECTEKAMFDRVGAKKPNFCLQHRTPGMVYIPVGSSWCASCFSPSARYHFRGESIRYCKDCKYEGMVAGAVGLCANKENYCQEVALYNYPHYKRSRFCKKCKIPGMVLVNHAVKKKLKQQKLSKNIIPLPRCSHDLCDLPGVYLHHPLLDLPPGSRSTDRFCKHHKTATMLVIGSKFHVCQGEGCANQGIYGTGSDGEKENRYCEQCKLEGMIKLKPERCSNCGVEKALFNFPGENRALYCYSCKIEGMLKVNNSNLCKYSDSCGHLASFNYEGLKPEFCSQHKSENMVHYRRHSINRSRNERKLIPKSVIFSIIKREDYLKQIKRSDRRTYSDMAAQRWQLRLSINTQSQLRTPAPSTSSSDSLIVSLAEPPMVHFPYYGRCQEWSRKRTFPFSSSVGPSTWLSQPKTFGALRQQLQPKLLSKSRHKETKALPSLVSSFPVSFPLECYVWLLPSSQWPQPLPEKIDKRHLLPRSSTKTPWLSVRDSYDSFMTPTTKTTTVFSWSFLFPVSSFAHSFGIAKMPKLLAPGRIYSSPIGPSSSSSFRALALASCGRHRILGEIFTIFTRMGKGLL
eukprot:Awhi_evm1s14768